MNNILFKHIEGKTIVWFEATNNYIVLENKAADIISQINDGLTFENIGKDLAKEFEISEEAGFEFVNKINEEVYVKNTNNKVLFSEQSSVYSLPIFQITKFYRINDLIFEVNYQSEFEEYLVHPKFSHLEVDYSKKTNHTFKVFTKNDITSLIIDGNFIGSWPRKDIHYFQGKFSMYVVQFIHQKHENEWMGIFHASGLGNDKKSLLLLGDSGNGKSTSLAILQANGLTCLADDFVPIDVEQKNIYTFPSAISIKRNSLETLLPLYPELENTAEFHFKRLNKIVRFLPPKINSGKHHLPCNDLVFIKYQKDSALNFANISKLEAFQQLVPDSWLSQKKDNVEVFLNWFSNTNCYKLTYSDNERMVNTVKSILNNDI
ncbi:hypothetical protein BTO06_11605 [Tenacibaculum sp. SZ-18]|uniref:hypothetical protein n=1 Tax=Tenacibaculum sp. SZ-18 TaxID=754423 RepID=UPI000C2D698A|nr:hypothetical protein [Tenacibaculum sp. SZ-18]AUC15755.1 hypothetical protein BTO06_11605 [Tenacibaculum sp. SZ-18]